jgi:ATP-dependent DNA helicase RecG
MTEREILAALSIGEGRDWEFKSAKGGVPGSLWETYSAMANTDGGTIVLGVEQKEKRFSISGLDDPEKTKSNFWSTINNRGKVSINLLSDKQAEVKQVTGKPVLVIRVPRASRRQRPVYIGQNPLTGTFRRNFEGDYHCSEDEVGRMLADRAEEPADSRILENFNIADLDSRTLQQYRQRFSARAPDHPWLGKDLKSFLEKLGGWRKDRTTAQEGLTVAGLLMFGKDEAIRDPDAIPEFQLDFRERLSDDPEVRWTDRVTIDGTWAGNLFQFYQRVIQRLTADLKIPFRLEGNLFRKDDTIVHEAIREALVNALIHADYRGQGGILIEKYRARFELSNPGTLLVSFEQLLKGGVSECRNKAVQTMFLMIGGGERAGSGIDKMREAWKSQHWRTPGIQESFQPDRVRVVMPMVSLLPEESVKKLDKQFGEKFQGLGALEVQALVTAESEGQVSNGRMRELCDEHPADLTRMLQGLLFKGFLKQVGQKRGTSYQLIEPSGLSHKGPDSLHKSASSLHKDQDSSHLGKQDSIEADPALLAIALPAKEKRRLSPAETESIILRLCDGRFLTAKEIATLLGRNQDAIRNRFLTPLVDNRRLVLRFPRERNRPDQAYAKNPKGKK